MYLTWNGTRPKFRHDDPRERGYTGNVEDVNFDYDMEAVHRWNAGTGASSICLGRKSADSYKVFRSAEQCQQAGYEPLGDAFDLPHPRDAQRLRYADTSEEGLASEIKNARVIAVYDADWQTQHWSWSKSVPPARTPGSPAGVLLPLEIAVDSPSQLEAVKTLVFEIKEGKVRV